jgi:hypothetical protein
MLREIAVRGYAIFSGKAPALSLTQPPKPVAQHIIADSEMGGRPVFS